MNFQRGRRGEELELNLIPLIDVLLVIIIFLMLTTTYSRFSGLEINLPTSETQPTQDQPREVNVVVTAKGEVLLDRQAIRGQGVDAIAEALRPLVPASGKPPLLVISADASATHQSVIDVMQAAQRVGLSAISFATQAQAR